ncbi:MAG: acyl-CoA thioesterase [Rhodobiaceae bacterium]|jgi:acyl-CoA thioester hydrolase|nr:acyl-CoA thioesterase [Rhodobiaceae bacterium]
MENHPPKSSAAARAQEAPGWVVPPQHILSVAVRDEDIDAFRHVNNVVYVGWMARCAWSHSQALGFDFAAYEAEDCGFVVTRHEIDYRAAALAGDTVHIATWITGNDARLKLTRHFQMISEARGKTLALGMSQFAAMKLSTAKACRMAPAYATGYRVDAAAADFFAAKTAL